VWSVKNEEGNNVYLQVQAQLLTEDQPSISEEE
jgi:hypothetical protein